MNREYKKLRISDLHESERNVRIHSDKQIEELKRSIKKWGQTRAIVCDENHNILIGNGLFIALSQLGWEEADCYIYSGMSENDKKKLMMADNKIYTLGVDNLEVFEEFIAEMKDFDIPGYDPGLLETLCFEFDDADDYMSGYGVIDVETKANMEKAADKYKAEEKEFEASAERIEPVAPNSPLQQPSSPFNSQAPNSIGSDNTAQGKPQETLERRFVICPKCGERIWL